MRERGLIFSAKTVLLALALGIATGIPALAASPDDSSSAEARKVLSTPADRPPSPAEVEKVLAVEMPKPEPAPKFSPALQAFAERATQAFETLFDGSGAEETRLRDYAEQAPLNRYLVVRVWFHPDGKVAQVEFPGFDNDKVEADFRTVLSRADLGSLPPGMPQPVIMKLSLPTDAWLLHDKSE